MLRTIGETSAGEGYVNMSFRQPQTWESYDDEGSFYFTIILFGDDECGPGLFLTYTRPGIVVPRSIPHTHASDNWRISLLGDFHMGRDTYGPGDYRLQEGGKVYPDDNVAYGAEGGWEINIMADRRGMQVRPAIPLPNGEEYHEVQAIRDAAIKFGFAGDALSDDPSKGAGPSAIASTMVPPQKTRLSMGHLNGTFADSDKWTEVSPATRVAVTLFGEGQGGPVLIFTDTKAGQVAMPGSRFGTEMFRAVVSGSCMIGDQLYQAGDVRVQEAGASCETVRALDDGLKEVIVLGDRRVLNVDSDDDGWPRQLPAIVGGLQNRLDNRNLSLPMSA